jgi:molybdopterin molybdotransferase
MNAPRPLLSLDDALARVVASALPHRITQTETISTFEALGRVLAADVLAGLNVPPQDNTSMDGYALRVADVAVAGKQLPVSQRIPAGHVGQPLAPGTAARIFTGGWVPAGADAVVMQEQCDAVVGEGLGTVRVNVMPASGQWIRRQGEDVQQGAAVLTCGQRLTPQALGLAASVGAAQLTVLRKPRAVLFSTGDELMMPGEPLRPGAIYNSNRFTLRALLMAAGCDVTDFGIVEDKLDTTRAALRQAAAAHDLIITCGGVSVGEEDHLKPAAKAEGELQDWQIAIKPGKPLAMGQIRRPDGSAALLIGLPGNPVSAYVTYLLAVTTALRVMQGMPIDAANSLPPAWPLRADFDWPQPDKRREFLRVRLNSAGGLDLFDNQSSGVLTSVVWADGLLDNPAGQVIQRGDTVRFLPLSELITR